MKARFEVPIIGKKAIARGTTEFTLDISKTDFRFTAGQYATITLPNMANQPATNQSHDYSIVSSPNDHSALKFAIRDSTSVYKTTLFNLPPQATVMLEGPSGIFTLPQSAERPLVFIAGGIGITPFMSMLQYAYESGQKYQIILFYSNRNSDSTVFETELKNLAAKYPAFKIVFVMTDDPAWKGERRQINSALISSYIGKALSDYVFYVAGPPALVAATELDLEKAGVSGTHINTESFTGYMDMGNVEQLSQKLTGSDYAALISSLNQTALVSMTDAKGNIIYANQKFVDVSKYSLNELLGQNHRILKSGQQPDQMFTELWTTITSGKVWRGEIKNKAKEGTYYWADTSIAPILGSDNIPERYISVSFLITERKEKEQTLSGLLSSLDQTALVSMTDAKGDIIYANQKFVDVSKYALYELMGQNHRILKSGGQPDSLFTELWSTIAQGKVWRGEIKNKAKDGTYYWVDTSISPIIGADGRPERYISVRFLITEKKEREQSLQQAKSMDDAILSSIGDGLIATDQFGRIMLMNPEAERLLGWKAADLLGRLIEEAVTMRYKDNNDIPLHERPFHQVISIKKPITMQSVFYVKKDGQRFPAAVSAAPIVSDNTLKGVIEVFRDTTQDEILEHMKDEFLSIASHELRTPMGAVRANLAMILAGDYGPVNDSLREPLEDMKASAVRLVNLVNDLLDVANIEAGRIELTLQDFDIQVVLHSIAASLSPLAKEKNVPIIVAPGEAVSVQGDMDEVKRVLTSLIDNALTFTTRGSITLATNVYEQKVEVTVTDTGTGIQPEDQKKLFGKFEQATTPEGKAGGTGLGLYISRAITRKMGGELWIKASVVGQGSTFAFTLPRAQTQVALQVKQQLAQELVQRQNRPLVD